MFDNEIVFISEEFVFFMFENGIKYIIFVFKYLVFNGFVERYVCIFKEIMKKMVNEKGSFDIKLSRFLFSYCIIF